MGSRVCGHEEDYIQQRVKLQMELEQLMPVTNNDLEQAVDFLNNFESHWNRLEGDEEARHELINPVCGCYTLTSSENRSDDKPVC